MSTQHELLNNIVKLSPVKPNIQNNWKKIHKKLVNNCSIEQLTCDGLLQAIDNVAYHITLNSKLCIEMGLTDEEFELFFEDKLNKLDDIVRLISLSSGIHPITIDLMIGFRTDHYTDYFIQL